jgi:hypothetical protein
MDDAEQQMRRALGLYGDQPRQRPEGERSEPAQRTGGGGFAQGGLHRRRFVQDGDVPVTVVAHGGTSATGPTTSRLQRVETALAAETAGRDRAERTLHEVQAALQALQTKMGHNDLAKNEAVAASKRHLEEMTSLQEELATSAERFKEIETRADEAEEQLRDLRSELTEERRARKLAERLLREATEQPALAIPEPVHHLAHESIERAPAPRRGRPPTVHAEPEEEPEPVKWWLLPTKAAAKRR